MTTRATPKLVIYVALATFGCLAGLALGRPEPVLLVAPMLLALLVGAALHQPLSVRAITRLSPDRAVEGDELVLSTELTSPHDAPRLEIALRTPRGIAVLDPPAVHWLALAANTPRTVEQRLRCDQWGGFLVGEQFVRAHDAFGLFVSEGWLSARRALRVYPKPEAARGTIRLADTQLFAGNELARLPGEGIEFASVRPFAPGDRVRRINWRLTSRLGDPYVNDLHQERNTDVVLFLDTFEEAAAADGAGTRVAAVRAAAALAERYLQRRDRVGLITFGGLLHWLTPALGVVQRYRIIDALIDTDIVFSYATKEVTIIPPSVLPPGALVIVLSPLLDERAITALLNLHARRFDLAIIEISPLPYVTPPPGEAGALAMRIWAMDRAMMRDRFRGQGIAVVGWEPSRPLESAIREVNAFRRQMRRAHV